MKKFSAGILIFAAITAIIGGCGEKGGKNADSGGVFAPTSTLKVTVWDTFGGDYKASAQVENDLVDKWLREKSKVEIEDIFGNGGGPWDILLSKLIAGNSIPEIVRCGAGQGPAHFAKLNEINALWELSPEMLQKYAPNVWKRVPGDIWNRMKLDEKIYGIPYELSVSETTQPEMSDEEIRFVKEKLLPVKSDVENALWIRDDISQKLFPGSLAWTDICRIIEDENRPVGEELMDISITTEEEYEKLFYDIKSLDIKSDNGKTVYPFGYYGGDNWIPFAYLGAEMFGYMYHCYPASWDDSARRMRIPLTEDVVRESAKLQNKMIRDKAIDPEALMQTGTLFREKAANGNYIILPIEQVGVNWVEFNNQLKADGKPYQYRPLYANVAPKEGYSRFKQGIFWNSSLAFTKTMSETGVIQALNWINIQFSDEFEEVYWWGQESDGLYAAGENGERLYKDDKFNKAYLYETEVLDERKESCGIGKKEGGFYITAQLKGLEASRWNPKVMHLYNKFTPLNKRVLGFPIDSAHVTSVKMFPPCQAWSPEFASVPELVTYWSERSQWEKPFTVALTADSEENFNKKWDDAIANLNRVTDLEAMCAKMTEIAREQDDKLKTMTFDVTDGN
jgi:hypothetical protein